ncbi:phosphatase PAP2 family protein [Natronobacterium texcoconense]|uniref:PAP2 superfamily protein n=1 Tax=Natronobacterium texcoconense TaxID=1095778 RepID=A0A1H1HLC2_NATTX|nr:phosphatase PAP2 family protein [Natronobacterium texcoconense]SDR26211.1 PAP2 superfamily protein [Natronobacterium texcoconense]
MTGAGSAVDDVLFDESTNEAVRNTLPDVGIAFFELVTHLGDGTVLILFATLLYWFGSESRRRQRALVIAIGIAALAVSAGMKGIFLEPRPTLAGDYGGYSFPSAHAMGAAAFYGTIAVVGDIWTKRTRYAVAGAIILLVATSRVVIGVHFVGDVLVGTVLGLVLVAALTRDGADPGFVFGVAFAIAAVAYGLGSREFTTMSVGAAVGGAIAWQYVTTRPADPHGAAILVLGVLTLPALLALRLVEGIWDPAIHEIFEIVGYAAAVGAVLVVPIVAERLNGWSTVQWLQIHLPFSGRTIDSDQLVTREK